MAKAARKISHTKPTCPALEMARLIGHYNDLGTKFQELEFDDEKKPGDDQFGCFKPASDSADSFEDCARSALTLAPVRSLDGAVAKIIMAVHYLKEIGTSEMTDGEIFRKMAVADIMVEDALKFIDAEHGISAAGVGLGAYCGPMPGQTIAKAQREASAL